MVGSNGKEIKSKPKSVELVSADAEPLKISIEESADGSLDGEDEENENSNREVMSVEDEEMDEIIFWPMIGSEYEEKQIGDGVNDEEKDVTSLINLERGKDVDTYGETDEHPKEVTDGGNAATNVDVEDNKGKTNELKPDEDEPQMNGGLEINDVNTGEERNSSEVAAGVPTNDEGLAASGHGLMKNMSDDLKNYKEANKLNSKESVEALADSRKGECENENASVANEVKQGPEKVNRPKRQVLKKKLVKKKVVPEHAVASINKAKLQSSDGNNTAGEACKVNTNEHVNNEEKAEVKPLVKVNKKRNRKKKKKAPEGHSGAAAGNDGQKPKPANDGPGSKEGNGTNEQDLKNKEVEISGDGVSRLKRRKKKVAEKDVHKVVAEDKNKPGPSKKGKSSKRIDSMGMIFMCSSETKKDCYRYKLLGLPADKKDMVLKIYKGMRLFLFDFDLRLMYGIYKAAGPGGYNIEPRAFKSRFPSQVRFTVLEDCLPLTEEKFKKVLKDNYYTKNKFNCQLTSEQVKNLCKLFHETSKKAESKQAVGSRRADASSSVRQDRKRKRTEHGQKVGPRTIPEGERSRRRVQEDLRRARVVVDDRYYQPPVVYERETYLPPIAPATLYQPLPAQNPPPTISYAYERSSGADPYRRDSALDHRDLGLSSSRESRFLIEGSHHDPYVSYREPYVYREPAYEASAGREHYDYLSEGRFVEYYRPAEYRAPLPPYRRY